MLAKKIRVLELREIIIAKIEYKGSFQGIGVVYKKLMNWARQNGYSNPKINKTITIYHNDPNELGINNVRQSACIIADRKFDSNDTIKKDEFYAGKCALGRYEISFYEFKNAWTEMSEWVRGNNLEVSGKDSFEVYQNNFNNHPNNKCIIDICIPLK